MKNKKLQQSTARKATTEEGSAACDCNLLPCDARPVRGYEQYYAATPDGRVFSLNYRHLTGRIHELAQSQHPEGYWRVKCSKINLSSPTGVHRIVAVTFIDNPKNLPQVNHLNGNKSDNRVENLEWCDNRRNCQHAYDIGTNQAHKGEEHHFATITDTTALAIKTDILKYGIYKGYAKKLANKYLTTKHVIHDIARGKTWRHI